MQQLLRPIGLDQLLRERAPPRQRAGQLCVVLRGRVTEEAAVAVSIESCDAPAATPDEPPADDGLAR